MHSILSEHPRWVEHQARLAELERKWQAWTAKVKAAADKYQEAGRTWQAQVEAARQAGDNAPAPPAPPVQDDRGPWYLQQRQVLRDEEKRLLVAIANDVETAAAAREAELVAQVLSLADRVRPLAVELEALGAVLSLVRAQVDQTFTLNTRPHTRTALSVPVLVELVEAGRRPLARVPREQIGRR